MPIGIQPHVHPLQSALQANQFLIPVYQRNYEWTQDHWVDLWADLLYTKAKREATNCRYGHFFGTMCTISLPAVAFGGQTKFFLVDGQQRLMTVVLLAKAMRDVLRARGDVEESHLNTLTTIYAVNRDLQVLRIIPARSDATAFREILTNDPTNPQENSPLFSAYRFLKERFEEWLYSVPPNQTNDQVAGLLRTLLEGFEIVQLALPNSDQCYEIFQSLNDRGTPLKEADKVRNLCFMNLAQRPNLTSEQSDAYVARVHSPLDSTEETNSWIQMEEVVTDVERAFGEDGDLTDFMMRWGILVGGDQFGRHKTSTQLQIILDDRIRARSQTVTEADPRQVTADVTEEFIREMSSYRRAYKTLRLPDSLPHDAAVLRAKLQRVQRLGVGMASAPLVLYLLRQWQSNRQAEAAVLRCLNMLESYTVRRYLCQYNAKSDNRVFAAIGHSLYQNQVTGDQLAQALFAQLNAQQEINLWPGDETLLRESELANVYTGRAAIAKEVLVLLEREAGTQFQNANFQMEHILPRQVLTDWWRSHLGPEAESIHRRYRNTIGNLLLLTDTENLAAGTNSFEDKKSVYADADRVLVREVSGYQTWKETDIKRRTRRLNTISVQLWRREFGNL